MKQHPRHRLDPVFQNPTRFSVMAMLVPADRVEFRFVRDTVEVSDSALSQHVTALEQAGYVRVVKGQVARRPRTWLHPTDAGRAAFAHHVEVLNAIAGAGAGAAEAAAGGTASAAPAGGAPA